MLLRNKKIAIIGAGPVGLTMAKLLQQHDADVTVYERDKNDHTRISGATLDLHKDSGQEAMKKAGLLEHYYALAKPMGRIITDEQSNMLLSVEPQHDNPEINRNDLRKLLLGSLASSTVIWNSKLAGLEQYEGKWILHFEHGPHKDQQDATADLVIGANGGMSGVRKWVTDAEIEYTGTIILQGEVGQPERACSSFYKLCSDNILMTAHHGNLVIANPSNRGILSYSVIFKKSEAWEELKHRATEDIIEFLSHRLSYWHACYKELIRATSSFVIWPTRKISLDMPWKRNRPLPITLIGDAAHIMPPFAGQGVNTGLMDAMILSDNLTNGKFETIDAAIRDYEQRMFAYAGEAQRETSMNERAMHDPGFSFLKRFVN